MKFGKEVDISRQSCPACGYHLDVAFCVGKDAQPSPGDVTICAVCAAWLVFDSKLNLERAGDEALAAIRRDRTCCATEATVRRLAQERNKKN